MVHNIFWHAAQHTQPVRIWHHVPYQGQRPSLGPYEAHASWFCCDLHEFGCTSGVEKLHNMHGAFFTIHVHENTSSHPGQAIRQHPMPHQGVGWSSMHPCHRLRVIFWCQLGISFAHTCTQHKLNTTAHYNNMAATTIWCITSHAVIWADVVKPRWWARSQHECDNKCASAM